MQVDTSVSSSTSNSNKQFGDIFGDDDPYDSMNVASSASARRTNSASVVVPTSGTSTSISSSSAPASAAVSDRHLADSAQHAYPVAGGGAADGNIDVAAAAAAQPHRTQIERAKDRLFEMLDQQATIMAFLLYIVFAFLATGATDWTVSFGVFAFAVRIVLHGLVSVYKLPYTDIGLAVLCAVTIAIGFPLAETTAGAGVWAYTLLNMPWYAEEALKNNSDAHLYRKRAVQFFAVLGPIATSIFMFFQLDDGLLFDILAILLILVYIASIVLRALEFPVTAGGGEEPGQEQSGNGNASGNANGNASAAANVEMQTEQDMVGQMVGSLRQRKSRFEQDLAQSNPQMYEAYKYVPTPRATAVCTALIFVLLVVNVATFRPTGSQPAAENATGAPTEGGASPGHPYQATSANGQVPVFPQDYYLAIGLVSAYLIAALELCAGCFLPPGLLTKRHRRWALLGFAFIISFLPASFRMYPAALALAAIVPWIVFVHCCDSIAESRMQPNQSEQQQQQQDAHNSSAVEDSNANSITSDPHQAPAPQQQQQQDNGAEPPLQGEQLIMDIVLPTVVTALILLLSTGAEDKRPDNFLTFAAILAHGGAAYFLWSSLKNSVEGGTDEAPPSFEQQEPQP